MAEHRARAMSPRDVRIRVWRLSGESRVFHGATLGKVRSLRVTIAEHYMCCVGQVRLLLEVTLHGRHGLEHHGELADRVAAHLGCSPEGIPLAAGDVEQLTLPILDGLTLWNYGYRAGHSPPGRMSMLIADFDAVGHVLAP